MTHLVIQVNEALGLNVRPSKPLLWKLGGHPRLPPSQYLYSLACKLQQLCLAATLAPNQDPAALGPVRQLLTSATKGLPDDQHTDSALSTVSADDMDQDTAERISDETALTLAANLAADVGLRQALQEGIALFQLAVSRAAGQQGSVPMMSRLGSTSEDPTDAAAAIVDSLQHEMESRALQVTRLLLAFLAAPNNGQCQISARNT